MTSASAWKNNERFIARLHGEERSGPKGHGVPDATTDNWPVGMECKLQTTRRLTADDMKQADVNAAKEGLPWALFLHNKGSQRAQDLVIMPIGTYLCLITGAILAKNGLPTSTHQMAEKYLAERKKCKKESPESSKSSKQNSRR